jgi:hypothetical protein
VRKHMRVQVPPSAPLKNKVFLASSRHRVTRERSADTHRPRISLLWVTFWER